MPLAVPPGAGKKTHEAPRLPQKAPDPAPALSECGSLAQVVSIVRLDKSTDEGASLAALLHFIFQLSVDYEKAHALLQGLGLARK